MAVTPWADDILGKDIAYNGTVQSPRRKILNFVPGSGISITVADNTGAGSTDVTIISNGSLTGGVDYKDAVRAATTGNITLSALQTIDGVVLAANDRVLVWQQTTPAQNGIYVASAGAWQRASDASTSPQVTSGLIVPVSEGTLYTKSTFKLTTINPITLGVTGLVFERQPRTLDDVLSLGNVATNNPLLIGDTQFLQVGVTGPATGGKLRFQNGAQIRWRNAANTGNFGIEIDTTDTMVLGGGSIGIPTIRHETTTLQHTTGGPLNWQSMQLFPNMPTIYFDPACGNGTGTYAFVGVNAPATARTGMSLALFGGPGGTGNQNGGDLILLAGSSSGTGTRGAVRIWDDLNTQTELARFDNGTTPRIELFLPKLRFGISVAAPVISQADQTAASTNGQALTLQAQNATGATSTGANLVLASGTGTTAAGNVLVKSGATQIAQATPTTFEVSTGAWLNIIKAQALGGGAAATLGTIGGTGPTAAAQNKWVEIQSNGTKVWVPAWI